MHESSFFSQKNVDINAIIEIYEDNDPQLIQETLAMFKDNATSIYTDLIHAIDNKNCTEIRSHAHKLKSCAKIVGAETLFQISLYLENIGKSDKGDAALEQKSRLQDVWRNVLNDVEVYL